MATKSYGDRPKRTKSKSGGTKAKKPTLNQIAKKMGYGAKKYKKKS